MALLYRGKEVSLGRSFRLHRARYPPINGLQDERSVHLCHGKQSTERATNPNRSNQTAIHVLKSQACVQSTVRTSPVGLGVLHFARVPPLRMCFGVESQPLLGKHWHVSPLRVG